MTRIHKQEYQRGRMLIEAKEIESEVMRFYKELLRKNAPSLLHIDIDAVRRGSQLQQHQAEGLIVPISDQEIWSVVTSLGENKALGIDGFTSKFFKPS